MVFLAYYDLRFLDICNPEPPSGRNVPNRNWTDEGRCCKVKLRKAANLDSNLLFEPKVKQRDVREDGLAIC